jgi:subfamily B ATP-binding cassette protein MsbA
MSSDGRFAATLSRTWRAADRPLAISLCIVALGGLAAALEGSALLLFIPLIRNLSGAAAPTGSLERFFESVVGSGAASSTVLLTVALLCLLVLAKNVVAFAGMWLSRRMEGVVAHRLRVQLFEQTLASCIDYRPGIRRSEIVTTLTENSWKVAKVLGLSQRLVISAGTIIVFGALLALISAQLLFFAALILGLGALVIRFATRTASLVGDEVVRENKRFGLQIWEGIQGLQLIRTFSREKDECERLRSNSERVRQRLLHLDLLWGVPGPLTETGILLLIGGLILLAQHVDIGVASLATFLTLLYRLQTPARELLEGTVSIDGMAAGVADVETLLEETRIPFLKDGTRNAPTLKHGITLDHVSFRYDAGVPPVVDGISVFFPAGQTTAIVGPSGAGKSTLLSLIARFQDPTDGRILIDDEPLEELRLASWRGSISLMPQEVQLFNDSIGANIAFSRPDASTGEIMAVTRVAHAEEFIAKLPQGLDTVVGDRGLRLSGGQRQRIALARTLLQGADIMLLDEPTNALDVELEHGFQQALRAASIGRTVIVIAHRLSTVMRADQVVVMQGGKVIEIGRPSDLITNKGKFEQLYNLQRTSGVPG